MIYTLNILLSNLGGQEHRLCRKKNNNKNNRNPPANIQTINFYLSQKYVQLLYGFVTHALPSFTYKRQLVKHEKYPGRSEPTITEDNINQ